MERVHVYHLSEYFSDRPQHRVNALQKPNIKWVFVASRAKYRWPSLPF